MLQSSSPSCVLRKNLPAPSSPHLHRDQISWAQRGDALAVRRPLQGLRQIEKGHEKHLEDPGGVFGETLCKVLFMILPWPCFFLALGRRPSWGVGVWFWLMLICSLEQDGE